MSWLVNSIANSLKLDDDDDDSDPENSSTAGKNRDQPLEGRNPDENDSQQIPSRQMDDSSPSAPPRGVKEDLSEISQSLTRQFWGVASFLAPPPQISDRDRQSHDDSDLNSVDSAGISGIRNDLSEIGGKFRTGISKLSGNKAVSEFTKIASNFLQFGMEEGLTVEGYADRGVIGVTEEVVAFAKDIALHPETWLDFPLPDEDDDEEEDFDLADAQQEHALAVERLVPELAALRSEICLGYMSEASFWKIYFVLVHPRLSKDDALILSTPEIVKARAMLSQELRSRGKSMPQGPQIVNVPVDTTQLSHEEHLSVPMIDQSDSVPVEISSDEPPSSVEAALEMDKRPVTCTEIPVVEKAVVEGFATKQPKIEEISTNQTKLEEVPTKKTDKEEASIKQTNIEQDSTEWTKVQKATTCSSKSVHQKDEDDVDDWLKEENSEEGALKETSYPLGNDDDISFSDLEEED